MWVVFMTTRVRPTALPEEKVGQGHVGETVGFTGNTLYW